MKVDVTTLSTRDDRAEWRFAWVRRLPSGQRPRAVSLVPALPIASGYARCGGSSP